MSQHRSLLLDVLEVGGRGGVFQHSLAACVALVEAGHRVVLHTARDCEIADSRLEYCYCFDWKREKKALRPVQIGLHFLIRTVPHLAVRRVDAVWVQGTFKALLTLIACVTFRASGARVLFSPHNLFSRSGRRGESIAIRATLKVASEVITYNVPDRDELELRGIKNRQVPLVMYAPPIPASTLNRWASRLAESSYSVCSIGQIRQDKNIGLLIDACRDASTGLVVMGPDAGGSEYARMHVDDESVIMWLEDYFPLEDMAAVLAIVGTVALPYSVASQSAVAVLAQSYGAKVIAYDTGGLSEQADVLVPSLERQGWAEAIGKIETPAIRPTYSSAWLPKPLTESLTLVRQIERSVSA